MALTSGTKLGSYEIQSLELSPDGQRLLMIQAPVQDSANLTLVVNWPQELKK